MLPSIFEMDDYNQCDKENNKYYELQISLNPLDISNKSPAWNAIEATKNNIKYYDHGLLYHQKCINDTSNLNALYQNKYEHHGLNSTITKMQSMEPLLYSASIIEPALLSILLFIVVLIIYATARDIYSKWYKNKEENKYIVALSLSRNLQKTLDVNKISGKTKSLQGLRVFTMLIILLGHLIAHHFNFYLKNPEYVENIFSNPLTYVYFICSFTYVVQPFFVLSSFLLSVHVHEIYDQHKKFNLKFVLLLFINRYLRLVPIIMVMVIFTSSSTSVRYINKFPTENLIYKNYIACKSSWLPTIALSHNRIAGTNCHTGAWYASADFQLYLMAIILLYIKINFKIKLHLILGISAAFASIYQSHLIYSQGLDFIHRFIPQHRMMNKMLDSYTFMALYKAAMPNLASYLVGIYFGHIYYVNRNNKLFKTQFIGNFWWMITTIIPIIVYEISSREFSKEIGVIIGPVLKPLYAIGIGMLILGMIFDDESVLKKVCESNICQILSSITYSMYITHFAVVFTRYYPGLLHLSDYKLFVAASADVIMSIILGLIMYLFFELPAQNLQKLYIPQVPRSSKENEKNVSNN